MNELRPRSGADRISSDIFQPSDPIRCTLMPHVDFVDDALRKN